MELSLTDAQLEYAKALLESECLSIQALEQWLSSQTEPVYDLGEQLTLAGLVSEFELTQKVAKYLNLSIANDLELEMFAAPHPNIGRDICVDFLWIPLTDSSKDPFPIAISNPFDQEVLEYISSLVEAPLKLHISSPSDLRAEIDACYGTAEEWAAYLSSQEVNNQEILSAQESSPAQEYTPTQEHAVVQTQLITPLPSSDTLTLSIPLLIPDWSREDLKNSDRIDHFKVFLKSLV